MQLRIRILILIIFKAERDPVDRIRGAAPALVAEHKGDCGEPEEEGEDLETDAGVGVERTAGGEGVGVELDEDCVEDYEEGEEGGYYCL